MPYILLQTVNDTAALLGGGSPAYILAWVGIFFMVSLSGVGSAFGTGVGGSATVAAMKKRDDIFANCMILSALPGTQGLYGFGAFFILREHITPEITMLTAAAIFGAGLIAGVTNLLSAFFQARVVANGIESIGNGNDVFSNTLILAVYPELYAIIAFAACFLISGAL
ncbi:MAG: V-type ATP synthase subunit K [Candidatus Syntrophosphaera sp.]|jgi:V/A-type H+/Na+-transporting ATPase subunit K